MNLAAVRDLGTPLVSTTFVALDLETTGGTPDPGGITEIGAVKSVKGEVIGTFHTLVRPDHSIPAFISELTGIDDALVETAPPIESVLPSLYEFLRESILVAHNATFDSSFLTEAFDAHEYDIPFRRIVCTLSLARKLIRKDVERLGLHYLAGALALQANPCHRAFPDAQAALEIFHRLLEVAGTLGVLTLEDLGAFLEAPRPDLKRLALAARIPRSPGVYRFLDARGRLLFEGRAQNLRARVRSYFLGHQHSRIRISGIVKRMASIEFEVHAGSPPEPRRS